MMKITNLKIVVRTIIILIILKSNSVLAQPGNYVFSVTQGVLYQDLPSQTLITPIGWDDFYAVVPLGFSYSFMGGTTSTIYFDDNDMNVGTDMQFSTTTLTSSPFNAVTTFYDLEDRNNQIPTSASTVGYKTDLVGTNKITKIQWKNAAIYGGSGNDSANFQCWFYQQDNALEFRIGKCSRAALTDEAVNGFGFNGPAFILMKDIDMISTAGTVFLPSSLNPAVLDSTSFLNMAMNPSLYGVDSFPESNTLLRWAPPAITVSTGQVALTDDIRVFPTVVSDMLHIDLRNDKKYHLNVFNMNAQLVASYDLNSSSNNLDLNQLSAGNYVLHFTNNREKVVYRISKK